MSAARNFVRLTFDQRLNFKRAVWLNGGRGRCDLTTLRSLYRSVKAGQQFGRSSGYQP